MERIKNTDLYNRFLTSPMYNIVMGLKHPILLGRYLKYRGSADKPKVVGLETTLKQITVQKMSVTRFGDGELKWLLNENSYAFQEGSEALSERLKEVITATDAPKLAICIPDVFNGLSQYMPQNKNAWIELIARYNHAWRPYLQAQSVFYDANMSRFYIDRRDKSQTAYYFELLKQIWQDREVVIVEGQATRFGVGNDLLSNAKSVKRILGPAQNAFDQYDAIMDIIKEQVASDALILIALGPTATVMAYDLAKLGYQAIDIGHADLEYEWYQMKATQRVALNDRYVNEVEGGSQVAESEAPDYHAEIIATIRED